MGIRTSLRAALLAASRRAPAFRGKLRLTRRLFDGLSPAARPLRVAQGDVVFEVTGRDWIEFHLLYGEPLSGPVVATLERFARGGAGVFWDVGANIGTTSLPVAARCPELRVFAFEPSPPVLALLARNAGLNPALAGRVTLLGTALSDRSGPAPFFGSNESFNSGVGGLGPSHNRHRTPVHVWAARGDELVERGVLPAPELVKIDVEGFEPEVIQGLRETLRASRRAAVVFEHQLYRLEERGLARDALVDELSELGFSLSVIESAAATRPLEPRDLDADHDFLAHKGWESVAVGAAGLQVA